MSEVHLWPTIVLYLRVVIAYWWALLPGLLMPLIDAINWHQPEDKKIKLPPWVRLLSTVGILMVAQFLAYRNSIQNLSTVIEEKRQLSTRVSALEAANRMQENRLPEQKQQIKDLQSAGPRVVTRTLPAPEPEKKCWLYNYFGMPNSRIKGAVTATAALIHCNYKIDAPYVVQIEFDRDFIPGSGIPEGASMFTGGSGKSGKTFGARIDSPPLLSNEEFVATVYGETDQYPRALRVSVQTLK